MFFSILCIGKRPLTPPKEQGFVDKEHVEPVVTSPAEDPYEEFLKGQRKRQAVWNEQRAARRAKVVHTPILLKTRKCSKERLLQPPFPTGACKETNPHHVFMVTKYANLRQSWSKKVERVSFLKRSLQFFNNRRDKQLRETFSMKIFARQVTIFFHFPYLTLKASLTQT